MTSLSLGAATPVLTVHPIWPVLIGLGTAVWLGIIGQRYRHAVAMWAVGGFVLGLAISEICSGLANAVAVPYSHWVIGKYEAIAFAVSVVIIVLVGLVTALVIKSRSWGGESDS